MKTEFKTKYSFAEQNKNKMVFVCYTSTCLDTVKKPNPTYLPFQV